MFQGLLPSQDNLLFYDILLSYNCELHFSLSYMDKTIENKKDFLCIYNMA